MALSALDDKSNKPNASSLKKVLGRSMSHWDGLVDHIASEYEPCDETWIFSGANWGWSLRLKQKKRTVLYMTPGKGMFIVGFALGEKAVKAAHEARLPSQLLAIIDGATKYAEGRAVRLDVKTKKDLKGAMKIAAIKMAN